MSVAARLQERLIRCFRVHLPWGRDPPHGSHGIMTVVVTARERPREGAGAFGLAATAGTRVWWAEATMTWLPSCLLVPTVGCGSPILYIFWKIELYKQ